MNLVICGLIYDAMGVSLLGLSFIKKPKTIRDEVGTYWNLNEKLLLGNVKKDLDGAVGTSILLLGFIFQTIGQFCFRAGPWPWVLLLLLFLFVCTYASMVRGVWIRYRIKSVKRTLEESEV